MTLKDAIKALTESEKKYRHIFDEALEGIFQITPQGGVKGNPAMARIFGYDSPEELEACITNVGHQLFADPQQLEGIQNGLDSKGTLSQAEAEFIRKDQTRIWGSIKINKVVDTQGKLIRLEGLLEDITDQKYAEDALLNAYKDIEEKIDQRTKALQLANTQLKMAKAEALDAARVKGEFLANMSHEIRTPMNGVIAATDLALEIADDETVQKYLSIIRSSGDILLCVINDILDLSKIEAQKLRIEQLPFNITEMFHNLTQIFSARLSAAGSHVKLLPELPSDMPQGFIGDKIRLHQILSNLLGNAVKFTEAGEIGFGVKIESKNNAKVTLQFYVKDTGIGMDSAYQKALFEPFTQANTTTSRKYGGTGLGMTISKKLVELMGGNIWIESEPDKGSTFYFTIDVGYQDETCAHSSLSALLINKTALVVDYSDDTRTNITRQLNDLGLQTRQAASAKDALAQLKPLAFTQDPSSLSDQTIDLIVIDWLLPGLSGIDTIIQIRQTLMMDCPIILMTDYGNAALEQAALEAGADIYLNKPISENKWFDTVSTLFRGGEKSTPVLPQKNQEQRLDEEQLLSHRRILLAEDNPTNQIVTIAMLTNAGMTVDVAENGQKAVDAMYLQPYDAVLMDIEMPVLNGYEATQKIREDSRFTSVPIIAMTAHAMSGDEAIGLAAGMNGYMTKPINKQKLLSTLIHHLKGRPSNAPSLAIAPIAITPMESSIDTLSINTAPLLMAGLNGLEVAQVMEDTGLDAESFSEILLVFYHSNKNANEDIEQLFSLQCWPELRARTHSIKGSAANIGAYALEKQAGAIEFLCADASTARPDTAMIGRLQQELNIVLTSLGSLANAITTVAPPIDVLATEIDTGQVRQIIANLTKALEDSEPSKVKKHFTELFTHIGAKRTSRLKETLDKFEYPMAIKILEDLAISLLQKHAD